jgi:hypothetical protein
VPSPITSDTVNPGNPAQRFVPANSVVVNVAEPPVDPNQVNQLPNPDGGFGAYGWTTDVSGHNMQAERWGTIDPRRLPAERRGAVASAITGNITVVDATHIQVDPALSAADLRFPDGLTAIEPLAGYQVAIERVPALQVGGLPILWNVVTTPAVGAPATTPWLLEAADVGVALTPGSIAPGTNAYLVNYGSFFRVEWYQNLASEVDVRTIVSSARMGCAPGDRLNARVQMMGQPIRLDTGATLTNVTRQLWFNYYKADGTFISSQATLVATIGAGVSEHRLEGATAPAGVAFFILNMRLIWPSDTPGVTLEHRFSRALVQVGTATTVQPEEFPTFRNVFDTSSTLTIERHAMDSSSIELVSGDPTLDPAVSTVIRKGARVEGWIAINNDPSHEWNLDRLFTAKVEGVSAEYPTHNGKPAPITTITMTDGMADLAATPRSGGYAALENLPNVLEGGIVPWNVTGQTGQSGYPNTPDWINENASALDQVAITRDTHHAYAWLDRWGVFNVHDDGIDGTIDTYTRSFDVDDSNFSATAIPTLSTDDVINTIMITALRQIGDQTEEWKYGPFEDRASINVYGDRLAPFTLGVPAGEVVDATYWDAFVAEVFARNATPRKGYQVLPFSIDNRYNDLPFATVDLGDLLNVTSPDVGFIDEPFRVTSLKHTITLRDWLLELETSAPDSVAAPTAQPDLKSSLSEWTDIPLRAGFTAVAGETPAYQVSGDVVWLRGRVQGSHTTTNTPVGDLPADLAPGIGNELWASTLGSATPARFFVSSSGVLNINVATAGSGSVSISTSYKHK